MNKRKLFRAHGFTIVELLVVIVVIGILTAIVIVSGSAYIKKSADTTVQSNLQSAATAFRNEKAKKGGYPTTQDELDNLVKPNTDIALVLVGSDNNDFCINASSIKYSDINYYMGVNDTKPTTTNCASQVASDESSGGGADEDPCGTEGGTAECGGDETPPVSLPFSVAVNSKTCPAGQPATYTANITLHGTAGQTVSIMVANGYMVYTNSYANFTFGADGTVTGNITGSYNSGTGYSWNVYATNYNTDPESRVSAYLCS